MPVNPGSMYYNDGGIVGCPIAYCVTDETTPFYTDGEGISYYGGVVIVLPNLIYHNQMATFHPDFYVTITPTNEQIETDIANSGNNSVSYSVMDGNLVFDFYPPAHWGYYYVPKSPSINSKRYVINGTEYNQNVVKVFKVSRFDSVLTRPTEFEFVGSCEEPLYGAGINYNTLIFNRNVASNDDQDTSTLICYCHFLANGLAYAKNGAETQRTNVITDPVVKLNGSLVNEADMVVLPKRVALIEVLAQDTEVGFGARWGLLDETPFKGGKLITVLKDGNTLEDYNTNGNSVVDYQLYTENNDLTSMALEDCFVKLDDTHTDTFDHDPTYSGTYDPTIHNLPFFSPIGKLYINSELNENYLNTYPEPYVSGFEGNSYIYLDPILYADHSQGGDVILTSRFDDPLAYPVYGSPSKAIISTALLQELSNAMKSRYGVPDPLSVSDMINLIKNDSPVTEL